MIDLHHTPPNAALNLRKGVRWRIMESSFSIDSAENLVRMHMRGELTAEALTATMNQIAKDDRYRSGMHAVADFRECSGDWDYSEMQRFRDYVVHVGGVRARRWAAVVKPGTLVAIGHVVILISEAVGASIAMRLFEEPEQALRWVQGRDSE
jgi:hypothetical protein